MIQTFTACFLNNITCYCIVGEKLYATFWYTANYL